MVGKQWTKESTEVRKPAMVTLGWNGRRHETVWFAAHGVRRLQERSPVSVCVLEHGFVMYGYQGV